MGGAKTPALAQIFQNGCQTIFLYYGRAETRLAESSDRGSVRVYSET